MGLLLFGIIMFLSGIGILVLTLKTKNDASSNYVKGYIIFIGFIIGGIILIIQYIQKF